MSDLPYWIALTRISVLGATRIRRLVHIFGTAEKAFTAGETDLVSAGFPPKVLSVFLSERAAIDPVREGELCRRLNIQAITCDHDEYPALLQSIYDPPAVLFFRGDLACLQVPCVALVGSRKATEYGKSVAAKLAHGLACAGVVTVSGMARGIDTHAHLGALQNGGMTAAVLGCGLDICYPPENRSLRERIAGQGVVISEFPPGTPPEPKHFPMRNRIISGLSLATVVVEAAEKSGALITADCALEQGRDVFAVPGSIHSPASRGCHKLIKEGAAVAEGAGDILLALGFPAYGETAAADCALTPGQKKVLHVLEFEPAHFDALLKRSGFTPPELAALLVELELAGYVKKLPGSFYLRV